MPELFNVLTPDEARRRFLAAFAPLQETELVPVSEALGRVARAEVAAPLDLPAFPRSTMDGYAVRAADTYGASEGVPGYLSVAGEAPMGRAPEIAVGAGQAVVVHTGGMLPAGADTVVMVENTQPVDGSTIEVVRQVAPGENVIQVGEDVRAGEVLVPAGRWLRPQDLGGLMAAGVTTVRASRRPVVAILSTGDEVVAPGSPVGPGQVRDINTYTLSALVARAGGVPRPLGIVPDQWDRQLAAAREGLAGADVLVISAGSSVSARDMTAGVIASLGKPGVLVHGVAVRPGKPTILAMADGKPVVGLPGNPVSAMVVFELLVTPALYRLQGCTAPPPRARVEAVLARNLASTTGREDYVQVRLEERDGRLRAVPIFGESNLITTTMRADGVVQVPLDKHGLQEGETVTVLLY